MRRDGDDKVKARALWMTARGGQVARGGQEAQLLSVYCILKTEYGRPYGADQVKIER